MGYDDNSKISVFNAGVALAIRLDSLQKALNAARFNLQQFNPETETFNYQIMIDSLNSLRMESWSKLDKDEKVNLQRVDKLVKSFIKFRAPINEITTTTGKSYSWNPENFTALVELLDIYERLIKDALDRHALNSPNRDDDDEDDI